MPINRNDLPADLPDGDGLTELPYPPLGGSVRVRLMDLEAQAIHHARSLKEREPREGESEGEAMARANVAMALRLLATTVVDEEGAPLLTLAQWRAQGARYPAAVLDLANGITSAGAIDYQALAKN